MKNTKINSQLILKVVIATFGMLSLSACGDSGFSNGSKTFANKQLTEVEMTEGDEQALGLDQSEDDVDPLVSEDGTSDSDDVGEGLSDDAGNTDDSVADNGETDESYDDADSGDDVDAGLDVDEPTTTCRNNGNCNQGRNLVEVNLELQPRNNNGGNNGQGNGNGNASGGLRYICILDGPGKSIRLGLTDDSPAGQVGTPSVVCMSKSACLNEVSKVFSVKSAERRGFCPDKNPNVHSMDDDTVAAMIDAL